MPDYRTADGYPVNLGERYWDNDLDLVEITQVAAHSERNENTGTTAHWHKTKIITTWKGEPGNGRRNISDGSRLAKYHPFDYNRAK